MDINRIGRAAGQIWQRLSEDGELPLSELKKSRGDCTTDEVVAALGWLAREGKLSIVSKSRRAYVSLVREEVAV